MILHYIRDPFSSISDRISRKKINMEIECLNNIIDKYKTLVYNNGISSLLSTHRTPSRNERMLDHKINVKYFSKVNSYKDSSPKTMVKHLKS